MIRNQVIAKLFKEDNLTIKDIAMMYHLTSARVNQLLHRELGKEYSKILKIVNEKRKENFIVKTNCRFCGKPVERTTIRQYFCNRKCYNKFKRKNSISAEEKKAKRDKYARDYYLKKKYEK